MIFERVQHAHVRIVGRNQRDHQRVLVEVQHLVVVVQAVDAGALAVTWCGFGEREKETMLRSFARD